MAKKPQVGDHITIAKFANVVPMFLSLVSSPASKQMWTQRSELDRDGLLEMERGIILAGRSDSLEVANAIVSIRNAQAPEGAKRAYRIAFPIVRTDKTQRIVYGMAYCPPLDSATSGAITLSEYEKCVDTWGSYMDSPTLHALAHAYMEQSRAIDVQHSFEAVGAVPVESWITREATTEFPDVGAWVCGVKINDDAVWARVDSGELASFSIAVLCSFEPVEVRIASREVRMDENQKPQGTEPAPAPEPETRAGVTPETPVVPEPEAQKGGATVPEPETRSEQPTPEPAPVKREAGDFGEALAKNLGTYLPTRAIDCAMYTFSDFVWQMFYTAFYDGEMTVEDAKAELAQAATEMGSFLAGAFQVYSDGAATRSGSPEEEQQALLAFRAELAIRVGKKIAKARLDKIENAAGLLSEVITDAKDIVVEDGAGENPEEDEAMRTQIAEITQRMTALEEKVAALPTAEAIRAPAIERAESLNTKIGTLESDLAKARKDLDALIEDAPEGTVTDRGGHVDEPEAGEQKVEWRGVKMRTSLLAGRRS